MKTILLYSTMMIRQMMDHFHGYNHPGGFISGQSQSAKTASMGTMIEEDLRAGRACTVFDPHDQLYSRLQNFSRKLPKHIRDRMNWICPSEGLLLPITLVPWNNEAELAAAVETARRIIKQAFGDKLDENPQPNIDFCMDLGLEAAARLRLPDVLAGDFLDPTVAHHEALLVSIATVDTTLANRLAEISSMPPLDRMAMAGPALKRFDTVLKKNPNVRNLLSCTNTIDPTNLVRDGAINIISLKLGNSRTGKRVLRRLDRRFFYSAYANMMLQGVYGLEESQRREHTIWYDEVQLASALFEEIREGLSESAKYKLKQVGCTQTVSNFEDGKDSPILNAFLSNAHFHWYFRSQSELDSRLFSTIPFLNDHNPKKVNVIVKERQQFVESQDVITLVNRAFSWMRGQQNASGQGQGVEASQNESEDDSNSVADGESCEESEGTATRKGTVAATSMNTADRTSPDGRAVLRVDGGGSSNATSEDQTKNNTKSKGNSRVLTRGLRRGRGSAKGTNQQRNSNAMASFQQGGSVTFNQTLRSRYAWRDILHTISLLTPEQQHLFWQQLLVRMPTGQCLHYVAAYGTVHLVYPLPVDLAKTAPFFIEQEQAALLEELSERGLYLDVDAKTGQYDRLIAEIKHQLVRLPSLEEQLLLPEPTDDLHPNAVRRADQTRDAYRPPDYEGDF